MKVFKQSFDADLIPLEIRKQQLYNQLTGAQSNQKVYAPFIRNYLQPLKDIQNLYLNQISKDAIDIAKIKRGLPGMRETNFDVPPSYYVITMHGLPDAQKSMLEQFFGINIGYKVDSQDLQMFTFSNEPTISLADN